MNTNFIGINNMHNIVHDLCAARKRKGMTQQQVASLMKTYASSVARIELGGGSKKHSPTIRTLNKYALAVGYKIQMSLVCL